MNRLPKNPNIFELTGCYIAGGAIHSLVTKTEINDYDIYPKSLNDFGNILYTLNDNSCFVVNISDRAITFKSNTEKKDSGERMIVQVMFFDWFETSDKIFDKFDFTICMAAYDCDSMKYEFHPDFYPDIASKSLRFNNNTQYPISSLIRTQKYKKKGYHFGKSESLKLALAIANNGLPTSWKELESQIGGTYGRQIELDTKDLPYSYENAIEILNDFEFNTKLPDEEEKLDTIGNIINYFDKDNKEYVDQGDCAFFVDGFKITGKFSKTMLDKCGVPDNFTKSKNAKFFGYYDSYKKLDTFIGKHYNDFMYCSIIKDKKDTTSTSYLYLVSFDVSNVSYDNIVRAKNIFIEKEVTLESSMEDDIMEVLENRMYA